MEQGDFELLDEIFFRYHKILFEVIGSNYHNKADEWDHDVGHVHILLTAKPNTELFKFINAYKSES
ncbi:transposase [Bacillaceae bacterium Marseille-Q3522]|nr:transposase [Bacillaceae bacterium Marseille-Q3522]